MTEMAGQDWTRKEVELIVASYMSMLAMQLRGVPFVKAQLNQSLRAQLNGRTLASVEYKLRNISAVLSQNGWPHVSGYKPAANLQLSLRNEVEKSLRLDAQLAQLAEAATLTETPIPPVQMEPKLVDPPEVVFGTAEWSPRAIGIKRDYIYRDQLNRALGFEGELAAVRFEKNRLSRSGRPELAAKVEHTSETLGDGLGYDIKSFEVDGADRHIEVKTTTHPAETAFFVSDNEVRASEFYADTFHLFRFFSFLGEPGLFILPGAISQSCELRPVTYGAVPR